ncbi:hypothetical protein GOODEAATRI_019429, partial [Goodea atripinnis]
QKKGRWFSDSDVDSDEEIRRLVAAQQSSHGALQQEAEDDNLEVVGLDYLVKSGPKGDEEDYDSAGTDELFESKRNPAAPPQEKPSSPTAKQFSAKRSDKKRQTKRKTPSGDVSSSKPSSSLQKDNPAAVHPVIKHAADSHSDEHDEEEGNSSDSSSDFDFPALFSPSVSHLRISLADLQKLAETRVPSILGSGLKLSSPPERPAPKEAITPDEILASILGDDSSSDDEEQKKKTEGETSTSLRVSEGNTDECRRRKRENKHGETKTSEVFINPQSDSSSGSEEEKDEEEKMSTAEDQPSSTSCSEEDEQEAGAAPCPAPAPCSESSSCEEEEEEQAPPRLVLAAEEEEELQKKANMRRLAALQQRQKEAEEHKRLIQGALANLVGVPGFPTGIQELGASSGCLFLIQLMALQSRFGTDERFRMDSRFLEEEEEEETDFPSLETNRRLQAEKRVSLIRSVHQTDTWTIFLLISLIFPTAEYKAEKIQAPKVSWHQDPHGPRLFCRTSQLEEQREQWEERTSTLRQVNICSTCDSINSTG